MQTYLDDLTVSTCRELQSVGNLLSFIAKHRMPRNNLGASNRTAIGESDVENYISLNACSVRDRRILRHARYRHDARPWS